jgi:hypothetical protein
MSCWRCGGVKRSGSNLTVFFWMASSRVSTCFNLLGLVACSPLPFEPFVPSRSGEGNRPA